MITTNLYVWLLNHVNRRNSLLYDSRGWGAKKLIRYKWVLLPRAPFRKCTRVRESATLTRVSEREASYPGKISERGSTFIHTNFSSHLPQSESFLVLGNLYNGISFIIGFCI